MMLNGELIQQSVRMEQRTQTLTCVDPADQADRSLLQQVAAGDEKALSALYEKYGQRLYAYALRLTGETERADDALQEALIAVWRSAGRFRGEGRVIAWLLGIVHHQAVKSLRRRPLPLTPALAEDLPSQQPLPEDEVQAGDRVGQVREALQHLSHEHRAALELIFYQKLSYEEAAQVCGCPLGTMKSRVSQARLQMKGLLNRLEVEQ
jgi:RNA polymerase sigma-70 factor (ECF subfamily)